MPSITTWTRLEPHTRTATLQQGLQARIHDPLWLLARQWQFGEFQGEDAGSPIEAQLRGERSSLSRYYAGPLTAGAVAGRPYDRQIPLEALVEGEPLTQTFQPGRAGEAGLHFLRLLKAEGVGPYRAAYLAQYPLREEADRYRDLDSQRYLRVMRGRTLNGQQLYDDLRQAFHEDEAILPTAPAIAPADQSAVLKAATTWLTWYEQRFSEPTETEDAWVSERMEHTFAVSAPVQETEAVYVAHEYPGGSLDWYHFNQTTQINLGADPDLAQPFTRTVIPGSVSFQGMPDARWWSFEDATFNLSELEAGPEDLGRMLLLQYALTYSDDWFSIPVDLEIGSLLTIDSLVVTDTFGVRTRIKSFGEVDAAAENAGTWQMFTHTLEVNDLDNLADNEAVPTAQQLFLPPVLATSLNGYPVEEVRLLQDEMANMAWAVEHKIENARGQASNRHEIAFLQPAEPSEEIPEEPPEAPTADLTYQLMTDVPEHWIPLVAVLDDQTRKLRRGRMLRYRDQSRVTLPAYGRLLTPEQPLALEAEEVGRAGASLTRAYQYTRWLNGTPYLWMARHKRVGRGEGWSGLRYDKVEASAGGTGALIPELFHISPASGRQGQTLEVEISGAGLAHATAVQFSGTGIEVQSLAVKSDFLVCLTLSISRNAALGQRTFRIITPDGELDSQTFNLRFQVTRRASTPTPKPPTHYGSLGRSAIGGNLL